MMKNLLLTTMMFGSMLGLVSSSAKAQQDSVKLKRDSVKILQDSAKVQQDSVHRKGTNRKYKLSMDFGDKEQDVKNKKAPAGRFMGGITFTRLDIGFSRLIDNGSFSLSDKNKFLDYRGAKTSTVSFDVLYFGYRFNPNFKVYVAGGFDWTLIRLKNNITILPNTPELTYIDEPIDFSKNRFSNSYVHIPLNFEFRTKENKRGKRGYLVLGPEVSFLLNGKVKQISDERGKQKIKDDYDFQKVRLGGTFRIGYGGIGLFTKYYFNDMFDSAPQKGLKNMSFGITFGIN